MMLTGLIFSPTPVGYKCLFKKMPRSRPKKENSHWTFWPHRCLSNKKI